VNTSLTKISLAKNRIGAKGTSALAEALKVNSTVTDIDLFPNIIGDTGASALANALIGNTLVTKIVLGENGIGDAGASALANMLKVNTSVTSIDLFENHIGADGALALTSAFKMNTAVTNVDLSFNPVGVQGSAVEKLCARNKRFQSLFLLDARQMMSSVLCGDECGVVWSYFFYRGDTDGIAAPDDIDAMRAAFALIVEEHRRLAAALADAVVAQRVDEVRSLLAADAGANSCGPGNTPVLFEAVRLRQLECVKALLIAGADPTVTNGHGATTVIQAAGHGDDDCLRILLHHNVDIDATTVSRTCAVFAATMGNHENCLHILLEGCADPNTQTTDGQTALFIACVKHYGRCVKMLCEGGASMELATPVGKTPLMKACQMAHPACVAVLVKAGCNVDAVDNDGRTALMYAVNFGQLKCVRALQRATTGVDTGVRAVNEAKDIDEVALDLLKKDADAAPEIRRLFGRACTHCRRVKKKMFKCGKCETVYYLTRECQRIHWPAHKDDCMRAQKLKSIDDAVARYLAFERFPHASLLFICEQDSLDPEHPSSQRLHRLDSLFNDIAFPVLHSYGYEWMMEINNAEHEREIAERYPWMFSCPDTRDPVELELSIRHCMADLDLSQIISVIPRC
jgi:hypothetical protein